MRHLVVEKSWFRGKDEEKRCGRTARNARNDWVSWLFWEDWIQKDMDGVEERNGV
jgi:hypothetical protein